MDDLEEMDKFSEKYSLSRLNQGEIKNMNRSVISTEIEAMIKNLPMSKSPGSMTSQVNAIKHLDKS